MIDPRKWLLSGGGGFEDGEDGLRACSYSGEGLIRMLEDYREHIIDDVLQKQGSYWTVRDPDGHLIHTVVSCEKEDAIQEFMETEQACNFLANAFRVIKGQKAFCAKSWEQFEAEGYSTVRVIIQEVPNDEIQN